MQIPTLAEVLNYQNEAVINHFCIENTEISKEEAEQIFQDLLAWLWLSVKRFQEQVKTPMIKPLFILDKMWHGFILHTRIYSDFCTQYFQRYLHHEVEPLEKDSTLSTEALSTYLHDCYDFLGEGWVLRNFSSLLEEA